MSLNRRLFLGLLLVAGLSSAQPANPEAQVRDVENRRLKAMIQANIKELGTFLADDLTYIQSNGVIENRAQFLKTLGSGLIRYRSYVPADVRVRLYGDTAILTGRALVKVTAAGKNHEVSILYTAVYARKGGRWQLAAWQGTRLPENTSS